MESISFSAKTLDDAITKACIELGVTSEDLEYEITETGREGVFGIGARPYVISVRLKEEEKKMTASPESDLTATEKAMDFLSSVFEGMSLNVDISIDMDEESNEMSINLSATFFCIIPYCG